MLFIFFVRSFIFLIIDEFLSGFIYFLTIEKNFFALSDDTHLTSMKIGQFSRPPTPLVQLLPKFFHPLDLGSPISNEVPPIPPSYPPSPNYKQSIKRKHNPRKTIAWIRSFLQVGFCSQYQLINLVWLFIDFYPFSWSQHCQHCPQSYFKKIKTSFSPSSHREKMCWGQGWAEASLSAFLWLCILVYAVVQKYHQMIFIYNYSQF